MQDIVGTWRLVRGTAVDGDGRSFGEMSDDEKSSISHRARAMQELRRLIS